MNRGVSVLAGTLLLAGLAHLALPRPPSDHLRGTLVVLPLVVASLVWLGRWAIDRGGRRMPAPVACGEAAALLGLVLLSLSRGHLGLIPGATVERCLAGGFIVLLMHHLCWLVPALRPSLGHRLPARPPWPYFALPLTVYLAILPWSTTLHRPDGDEPYYLLVTHSLAYDLDADLTNNYDQGDSLRFVQRRLEPQPGDPQGRHGEQYSRHNVLLPAILAPVYRLAGVTGALVLISAFAAAVCWLMLGLAFHYFPEAPAGAHLAWAVLAFTSPLLLFSYQVWTEVPATLLVATALLQLHGLDRDPGERRRRWLVLGLALALLPLLKIRFIVISVPLAVVALSRLGRKRKRIVIAWTACLLTLILGVLLANQILFRNPLKYHQPNILNAYSSPPSQYLQGLFGLFFDCAFGLFAFAPIWMLLFPALAIVIVARRRLCLDFGVAFGLYLLLIIPSRMWFGGWSPPFRYAMVTLPLLAVCLVPLLSASERAGFRFVFALLTVWTAALTTLWVVEPGWTYNLAHGRTHLLDHLSVRLSADVARLFPSSTRPRAATWMWPPVAITTLLLVWWAVRKWSARTSSSLWGVVSALLLIALVPWAARSLPTRIVEFEDPWLRASAGAVFPELWSVDRALQRGGWKLPPDASIEVPVVAGGSKLTLQVDLRPVTQSPAGTVLEISDAEGRVLDRARLERRKGWTTVRFDDVAWRPGDSLKLTYRTKVKRNEPAHALLDRAVLTWNRQPDESGERELESAELR